MLNGNDKLVARRLAGNGRQRLHEGVEVGDVGRLHARIGRVGKGRIEVAAVRRDAAHHGVGEIVEPTSCRCRPCGSGEMLGGTKVPNGVFSSSPPASSSRASPSDFGRAWQDVQPPAQKMRSPRVASPAPSCGESLRHSSRFGHPSETRTPPRRCRQARARQPISFRQRPSRSALLDAEGLVAAAAVLRRSFRAAAPSASTSWAGAASGRGEIRLELVDLRPGTRPCPPRSWEKRSYRRPCRCPPGTDAATSIFCTLSFSACQRRQARPRRRMASRPWPSWHQPADCFAVLLHDGLAIGNRIGEGGRCRRARELRWRV